MVGFRKAGETADTHARARSVGGGATIVCAGKNRGIQVRALRSDGWTKARRVHFLRVLGTTCNVRAAAADVGMSFRTAYALRLRDPAFAAAWAAALADGYDRLEEALLAAALAGLSGDFPPETGHAGEDAAGVATGGAAGDWAGESASGGADDAAGDLGGISVPDTGVVRLASMQAVQVALAMLGRFRAAQAEGGKRQKMRHRRATVEETNASIAKKLDALARRLAAAPAVAVILLGSVAGDDGGGAGGGAGVGTGAGPGIDATGTGVRLAGAGAALANGVRHER